MQERVTMTDTLHFSITDADGNLQGRGIGVFQHSALPENSFFLLSHLFHTSKESLGKFSSHGEAPREIISREEMSVLLGGHGAKI